jgi:ribosomal protein S17E
MGRIKSKIVKRSTLTLLKEENNRFTEKFGDNKELLKGLTDSKKVRNQIAGYVTRIKKRQIQKNLA